MAIPSSAAIPEGRIDPKDHDARGALHLAKATSLDSGASRAYAQLNADPDRLLTGENPSPGELRKLLYLFNGLCAGLSRVCWPCYR
ncbi:hypothetical protein [Bifidobacterium pullorum]|uniref:hypothetical protein n=1 Tax=Bifidobacterium pullorum TaxID=78448 RepID=UPI001EE68105|nr:hypothetical protein [Bifidobacterium pullorum]